MRVFFLLLTLLLTVNSVESQPYSWIDSVQFKEMNKLTSKINRIWFSNDGTKFFTWHEDKHFRIFDFENGNIIEERFLNYDYLKDIDFNEESNQFSVAIGADNDNGGVDINTYIYNFNLDTLIRKINLDFKKDPPTFNNKFTRFIKGSNLLLTVIDHTEMTNRTYSDGWIDIWDISTGNQLFSNQNIRSTEIAMNKSKDIFATSGYTSWEHKDPIYDSFTIGIRITDTQKLFVKSIGFDNKEHDIPSNLDFSFDGKYLAYHTKKNGIYIYDLETNIIFKFFSNGLENANYVPHNILFSHDSYDFYTSSWVRQKKDDTTMNVYCIRKWNLKSDVPVDSIIINVNETWKMELSPDSKYLIGASNTGRIRYWNLSMMKETPVEENINSEVKIYPNPTNDFLYINGISDNFGDISIYNSLGNLIMKENIKYKIDISFLPTGFYYLMIKDKVFKLIKL